MNIPILFEYMPGDDIATLPGGTFARTSIGYQTKRNLRDLDTIAAGIIRDGHYVATGVRSTLMENATLNYAWPSEDFADARWVKNFVNVTSNSIVAPDGTLTADTFTKSAGAVDSFLRYDTDQTCSNKTFTFSIWLKYKNGLATDRHVRLHIRNTLETVFPSTDILLTDQWKRYSFTTTFGAIGGNVRIYIESTNLTDTGAFYLWGAHVTGVAFASSYVKAVSGNTGSDLDRATFNFPYGPQAMWIYAKFIELGSAQLTQAFITNIGGAVVPQFNILCGGGNYQARYFATDGTAVVSTTVAGAYGDTVELLAILNANGSVQIKKRINGGAEVAAAASGTNDMATGWQFGIISLNNNDIGASFPGYMALITLRVGSGAAPATVALASTPATYIQFTDSIGTAFLSNEKPFPADRFSTWTPDSQPIGSSANRLSDELSFMFRTSDRRSVSFSLSGIPSKTSTFNSDGYTPMDIALRLIYHLTNGGTCIVRTGDDRQTSYSPCAIFPKSKPQLQLSNRQLLEYTLNLQLISVATVPQDFSEYHR